MNPVNSPVGTPYGKPGNLWSLGYHTGIDYLSPVGTLVVAPTTSRIVHAGNGGWGAAYGNHVIGETSVGGVTYRWLAAHLSRSTVEPGQLLIAGKPVGLTGKTGHVTGPHLHFEVRTSPYGFTRKNIVDPHVLIYADETPPPMHTDTVFDVSWWNVASPRWFKPWGPRVPGINGEIRGEASVYGFAECYDETQAATLAQGLGPEFKRAAPAGRAGLELFYAGTKWVMHREAVNYASGVQGRFVYVVHLTRQETGQRVAFVVMHAPALVPAYRTKYGAYLKGLLPRIEDPKVLLGDVNNSSPDNSPRKEIAGLGFRSMRSQTKVTNEGSAEFPGKKTWLSDIWTIPSVASIIGGELDITSPVLSDHRRIEARVRVKR